MRKPVDIFNALTIQHIKERAEILVYDCRNHILAYVYCKAGIPMQRLQNVNELTEEETAKFQEITTGLTGAQVWEWWSMGGGAAEYEHKREADAEAAKNAALCQVVRVEGAGMKGGFFSHMFDGEVTLCQNIYDAMIFNYPSDDTLGICRYEVERALADVGATTRVITTKRKEV